MKFAKVRCGRYRSENGNFIIEHDLLYPKWSIQVISPIDGGHSYYAEADTLREAKDFLNTREREEECQ